MHITQAIDKKRQELEINEKDDMYIYKEAKNTAYINQELINEYGKKAKTQSYDISKYSTPIKLYKQQFFDPTKDNYINNNIIKKLNYKGIVKLPLINKYYVDKKPLLTYSNSIISKSKMNRSTRRRFSMSTAVPMSVLMRLTASAPAASTARAISAMSVTLGESFTISVLW